MHLLSAGHKVTAVVRRSGSAPEGTREVVVSNIGSDTNWDDILIGHNSVIHLAARVHVMDDQSQDPLSEFRKVNTEGTRTLARAASNGGVQRFVFLSSIKVNGEETVGEPFTAWSETRPVDPYGISKLEAELALQNESTKGKMTFVVVRTPLVFGPGVRGNFLRILRLADSGVPLPLANVSNKRSMVSVWNLTDLLERSAVDPEAESAVVIASDGMSLSTPNLIRVLRREFGKPTRMFPFPVPVLWFAAKVTGQTHTLSRLVESLEVIPGSSSDGWSWAPKLTLEEGIRRTVAWYSSKRNEGNEA